MTTKKLTKGFMIAMLCVAMMAVILLAVGGACAFAEGDDVSTAADMASNAVTSQDADGVALGAGNVSKWVLVAIVAVAVLPIAIVGMVNRKKIWDPVVQDAADGSADVSAEYEQGNYQR